MLENFIKNYTEKITKQNIINFALKENIKLNETEVEIIYNQIKNNLHNLLIDSDLELEKIKDKLEFTTYLKIKELTSFYKEKFKNYL